MDSSSGTWTTVFFGLASSRISDKESSVVLKESFLDLTLLSLIYEFLIISYDSFCDGLSDSINLSDITWASNSNSDVKILEFLKTEKEDGLHNFDSQCGRFKKIDRWSINSKYTLSCSYGSYSNCVFLFSEALNKLAFFLWHDWLFLIDYYL